MSVTGDAPGLSALLIQVGTWFGGLVTSGVLLGMLDRWMKGRADARGERRQDDRDDVDDDRKLRAELRADLERERKSRREEEDAHNATKRDRDRGWDLARWWKGAAWRMKHHAGNARQAADDLARLKGIEPPPWKASLDLPTELEDPVTDRQPAE